MNTFDLVLISAYLSCGFSRSFSITKHPPKLFTVTNVHNYLSFAFVFIRSDLFQIKTSLKASRIFCNFWQLRSFNIKPASLESFPVCYLHLYHTFEGEFLFVLIAFFLQRFFIPVITSITKSPAFDGSIFFFYALYARNLS